MSRASLSSDLHTVVVKDNEGSLCFGLDIENAELQKVCLEHQDRPIVPRQRYEAAFATAQSYLRGLGYIVTVYGAPMYASEVKDAEVQAMLEAAISLLPESALAKARDHGWQLTADAGPESFTDQGTNWTLWPVLRSSECGLTVVYDPKTKQFGISQGLRFHGFWGDLDQTLQAASGA